VAWRREADAFHRAAGGTPNPNYDPGMAPTAVWQRSAGEPAKCWWQDEGARERHARELLAEAGRLARP
jgi:hypothetical protein